MKKTYLDVKDPSQKYKLAIYAISGIGICFGFYKAYSVLVEIKVLLEKILESGLA